MTPTQLIFYGAAPNSPLLLSSNNKFYGATQSTIFEIDAVTKTQLIYHFAANGPVANDDFPDGKGPRGLVEDDAGMLFGVTEAGGANKDGVIFSLSASPAFTATNIFDFSSATDGANPSTAPLFRNGAIYGATLNGGTSNAGVYYSYTIATDTYDVLHNFGGAEGSKPKGSLFLASDGFVYGTTTEGGDNNLGALFRCDIDVGNCTKEFSFTQQTGYGSFFTQITEL